MRTFFVINGENKGIFAAFRHFVSSLVHTHSGLWLATSLVIACTRNYILVSLFQKDAQGEGL